MFMYKKYLLIPAIILFLLSPIPIKNISAAPAKGSVFATLEYVNQKFNELIDSINGIITELGNTNNQVAINKDSIVSLEDKTGQLEGKITELENRITELENLTPADPFDFIFLNNIRLQNNYTVSESTDALGYNRVTFNYTCHSGGGYVVELTSSPDGANWFPQAHYDDVDICRSRSETFNTAGRYYKVFAQGGSRETYLSASAHFFNE